MFGHFADYKIMMHNNRNALMETLTRLGVERVSITYAGCGDSGDVETVDIEPATCEAVLDTEQIGLWHVIHTHADGQTTATLTQGEPTSVIEALKAFALDWLEFTHPGWEINDGGSGSIVMVMEEQRCELEHHQYYTESELHEYTL